MEQDEFDRITEEFIDMLDEKEKQVLFKYVRQCRDNVIEAEVLRQAQRILKSHGDSFRERFNRWLVTINPSFAHSTYNLS